MVSASQAQTRPDLSWIGVKFRPFGLLLYFAAVRYKTGQFRCSKLASDLGGAKGIRTPDLLHAMQTRYQLRHSPAAHHRLLRAGAPRKVERS